jgi:D-sedoheptulose 7-phosphate isomerase
MDAVQNYIVELQQTCATLPFDRLNEVIAVMHEARINGRQIFIMGNGGSASTASHFVADLAKNTRKTGWPSFKVIGLTDNMAIFSAYANDEGYESVFAQQLANLVRPADIVIAISASGNSKNVLRAVELANQMKAKTIGFTGFDGGQLKNLVDVHVHVHSNCIEHVEDIHLMMEHLTCKILREMAQENEYASSLSIISEGADQFIDGLSGTRLANIKAELLSSGQSQNYLGLLNALTREIDPQLDRPMLLQKILSVTMQSVGAYSGSIMVFDESGEMNAAVLAYAGKINSHSSDQLCDVSTSGLAHWVIENREAALVPNTIDDPRWLTRDWEREYHQSRSAISVPIMERDRVAGVLTLVHPKTDKFTRDDLVFLSAISVCISFNYVKALVSLQESDPGQVINAARASASVS